MTTIRPKLPTVKSIAPPPPPPQTEQTEEQNTLSNNKITTNNNTLKNEEIGLGAELLSQQMKSTVIYTKSANTTVANASSKKPRPNVNGSIHHTVPPNMSVRAYIESNTFIAGDSISFMVSDDKGNYYTINWRYDGEKWTS